MMNDNDKEQATPPPGTEQPPKTVQDVIPFSVPKDDTKRTHK
jgi:hypothetical protein